MFDNVAACLFSLRFSLRLWFFVLGGVGVCTFCVEGGGTGGATRKMCIGVFSDNFTVGSDGAAGGEAADCCEIGISIGDGDPSVSSTLMSLN
jgi:hypothetical protein